MVQTVNGVSIRTTENFQSVNQSIRLFQAKKPKQLC